MCEGFQGIFQGDFSVILVNYCNYCKYCAEGVLSFILAFSIDLLRGRE